MSLFYYVSNELRSKIGDRFNNLNIDICCNGGNHCFNCRFTIILETPLVHQVRFRCCWGFFLITDINKINMDSKIAQSVNDCTLYVIRGRRGRDHVVVGFTTTYAISVYHH